MKMRGKYVFLGVTLLLAVVWLVACAGAVQPTQAPSPTEPPPAEPSEAEEGAVKVCQVTDVGGIDDKSFNATAWKGVQDAMDQLGAEGQFLESQEQADYAKNIQEFIDADCDLIVTVGFLLGDATKEAANANPDQKFAIVDFAYAPEDIPANNVLGLTFNTSEAAFLAGYLAAGMTKTGTVATFGGLNIPPVTVFMDGFVWGVEYYNEQKGADVQVLGWDPEAQEGTFTGNFESLDDGRSYAISFFDEGADIVLPVAGPVGLGSAAVAQERGLMIIGVDTDWYISAPEYQDVELTSIMKNMDAAVYAAAEAVVEDSFEGGVYVGTLANDGVGLAPFHEFAGDAPDDLKQEIEEARQGIMDGTIKIGE
ncbi:MAG: Membrane lipoprotein TmpC [Anaerolineales bacterium]|nr:Membrane lipoprotein TmpC [Anaerolineales bacterium]